MRYLSCFNLVQRKVNHNSPSDYLKSFHSFPLPTCWRSFTFLQTFSRFLSSFTFDLSGQEVCCFETSFHRVAVSYLSLFNRCLYDFYLVVSYLSNEKVCHFNIFHSVPLPTCQRSFILLWIHSWFLLRLSVKKFVTNKLSTLFCRPSVDNLSPHLWISPWILLHRFLFNRHFHCFCLVLIPIYSVKTFGPLKLSIIFLRPSVSDLFLSFHNFCPI